MKYEIRVQPAQFEVIAFEYLDTEELTSEVIARAVDDYRRSKAHITGGEGIPEKELNAVVDAMLAGETVRDGIHIYERMSDPQKQTVQCLKRALKRINRRNGIEEAE